MTLCVSHGLPLGLPIASVSALAGQIAIHSPQEMHSGLNVSVGVTGAMRVVAPRPWKLMQPTSLSSTHASTQRPQRMQRLG